MELPKAYNWKDFEDTIYQRWEESGYFNPDNLPGERTESFSIMLPPPNATGTLHLGHAMYVVQDIMIRQARMQGKKTLWVPGTDHAAIATQSRVETMIYKTEGKTRHDIGRPELLKRIEAFVEESKSTIRNQLRKMGFSLDWSREHFTLEPKLIEAVQTMFMNMANDGLVYRGDRIVNWDPQLQTTVADDEQNYTDETAPFYYFQYGPFVIGTVRPETKFGDKYVVMHPADTRYAQYRHGQTIELEWINGPIIATIIKDTAVDPEFGSGVMTITPWHTPVDFDIAERHDLDKEQIIDYAGKLLPIAGEFAGLPIAEARPKIIDKLKRKGLLVKVEDNYTHRVARNYRGSGMIEPQIMKQWFVAVDKPVVPWKGSKQSLKDIAIDVVHSGDITIVPDRFNKTYFHWMENLHDWCISRQLWYGHRIPAWYCVGDNACRLDCKQPIISAQQPNRCPHCGSSNVKQDGDVLDTWFSAGMWTFSTLNWLEDFDFEKRQAKPDTDLAKYHPTSVLETGYDILFFWVARMILMTTYGMGEVPFNTVYLHGLVRDRAGQKMSKSKDNGIDPLDMSAQYGTDAVRLALVIGTTPGNDLRLYEEKIAGYRNFINKIWNVSRFVMMSDTQVVIADEGMADRWIQSRLQKLITDVNIDFASYQYSAAAERVYEFLWHEFADWYIEISKFQPNLKLTRTVLETIMKILHPFVPYITEVIWQQLGHQDVLMAAAWPQADMTKRDKKLEKQFSELQDIVAQVRNLRGQYKISYTKTIVLYAENLVDESEKMIIEKLTKVTIVQGTVQGSTTQIANKTHIFTVELGSIIDVSAEQKRLQKDISQLEKYISGLEKKLRNIQYTTNAPASVVEQDRNNLKEKQETLDTLKKSLSELVR